MSEYDLSNVRFLMSLTPDRLAVWWDKQTEDDREYAMEIMKAYSEWLSAESLKTTLMHDSQVVSCDQAINLLNSIWKKEK